MQALWQSPVLLRPNTAPQNQRIMLAESIFASCTAQDLKSSIRSVTTRESTNTHIELAF